MALTVQVLGGPGRDNALFVRVDAGHATARLLFDCGDGCPHALDAGELRQVDHLFFSHFHMDHVAGFDAFFRLTFDRTDRPNHVWGPPGTAAVLHHRLRGFTWNLAAVTTTTDLVRNPGRATRTRASRTVTDSGRALYARQSSDRIDVGLGQLTTWSSGPSRRPRRKSAFLCALFSRLTSSSPRSRKNTTFAQLAVSRSASRTSPGRARPRSGGAR